MPVPGGISFENFEFQEPFEDGQEIWFGFTEKIRCMTGRDDNRGFRVKWDVSKLRGELVTIELMDRSTSPWGFIGASDFAFE